MDIVLSTDSNYIFQTCVTIYSAVKNNPNINNIYVLGSELKEDDIRYIEKTEMDLKKRVNIILVNEDSQYRILSSGHLTQATFNRLMLDKLLPDSIEKILYLDSDIVVIRDISNFYNNKSLQNKTAAVVEGFVSKKKEYLKKTASRKEYDNVVRCGAMVKRKIGIRKTEKYFNAGVMLINLTKMRENHIGQKCIGVQKEIKYFDADQGVLNHVLKNDVLYVPTKYNCRPDVYAKKWQKYLRKHAAIFHYSQKPWKKIYVKGGRLWWKYAFELDRQRSLQILKNILIKRGE